MRCDSIRMKCSTDRLNKKLCSSHPMTHNYRQRYTSERLPAPSAIPSSHGWEGCPRPGWGSFDPSGTAQTAQCCCEWMQCSGKTGEMKRRSGGKMRERREEVGKGRDEAKMREKKMREVK
jgi:hypothetical protein